MSTKREPAIVGTDADGTVATNQPIDDGGAALVQALETLNRNIEYLESIGGWGVASGLCDARVRRKEIIAAMLAARKERS